MLLNDMEPLIEEEFKDLVFFGESSSMKNSPSIDELIGQCFDDVSNHDNKASPFNSLENYLAAETSFYDLMPAGIEDCKKKCQERGVEWVNLDTQMVPNIVAPCAPPQQHFIPPHHHQQQRVYKFKNFNTQDMTKKMKREAKKNSKPYEKQLMRTIKELQRENQCLKELLKSYQDEQKLFMNAFV